ncbi:S-layer homology domain-containing protein [Fusibacter ferrireducens]|uniref:S-layer homology domain-containing protein n=1 Tax=Fusibacter ferrireducens TaxID=2785058 RepID=A0ABR9ZT64_9FIRM|nr:S-layer homology domain-containing protein [Fusibacter ferrireducens]MBF4693632.1 S-layer homology domain-containing protein [Fusibacter ferrireducens]
MKKRKRGDKLIALLTTLILLATMIPVVSFAGPNDIAGHWAENVINEWLSNGLASGYPDNTFRPDAAISRAEFMALVNKAFYFTQGKEIDFKDVKTSDWYYNTVSNAVSAGYITGYPNKMMAPNQSITRQEAAIIIAKVRGLALNSQSISSFSDVSRIAVWSKAYVDAVVEAGYMKGYPDDTFRPNDIVKRGEAVVALNNTLAEAYVVYDKSGTYGPETGMETVDNHVVIKADGVILQNLHITGDLIVSEEVGDGDVTLNNLTVDGETYVRGGGTNSIHINGGKYKSVTVQKTSSGRVRVVATNIDGLKVVISNNAKGQGIVLEGSFESVQVDAPDVAVLTQGETNIKEMTVSISAANSNIDLGQNTVVKKIKVNSEIKITGKGTIDSAEVSVKNVTFETAPTEVVEVIPGAPSTPVTPTTPSGGGDNGNDSGNDTVNVTGVVLSTTSMALTVGGSTGTITATVTPTNATNKSVTWSSSNTGVATVSNGVVTAVAAGTANIKATSVANTTFSAICVVTVKDASSVPAVSSVTTTKDTFTVTFDQNITSISMPNTIVFGSGTYSFDVYYNSDSSRFGHYGLISQTANSMTLAILGDFGDLNNYTSNFKLYTGVDPFTPTVIAQSNAFNFANWADNSTEVSAFMYDQGEIWVTVEDKGQSVLLESLSSGDIQLFDGAGNLISVNFQVGSDYDPYLPSTEFLLAPVSGTFEGMYKVRFAKTGYDPDTDMFTVVNTPMVDATTPSAITLAVGSSNPVGSVTNVAIPAAGGIDTTGAVTGWSYMNGDRIKFTVTDAGSALSEITINSSAYTSGEDYVIATSVSALTVVVTTAETGKTTAVRTFTISVAENAVQATSPSAITLSVGSSNPVGGVTNVAIPAPGGTDSTGTVTGWIATSASAIKITVTDAGFAGSLIQINGSNYTSGQDYNILSTGTLEVVMVTLENGKATVVRKFLITVTP